MTSAVRALLGLLALASFAAACGGSPPTCLAEACPSQVSWKKTVQTRVNRQVDVLFVIDDTPAMAPHAGALATGLADTAQRLVGASPKLSLHVGVVRAGTCDQSSRAGSCGVTAPDAFLRSQWCGTITNAGAPDGFADALTCLGEVGVSDCGPAQPLTAALQTLGTPTPAGWEGFLRPEAYLMIVIVAATDDASGPPGSPTAISSAVTTLKALKSDPGQILVSIVGPGDCAPDEVQAPRLIELANWFGATGLYIGLCSGQLSYAIDSIVSFTNSQQYFCFNNVRDTDLDAPGLQASCTFEDRMLAPDGSWTRTSLPSCDTAGPPCWGLAQAGICSSGYQLALSPGLDWCDEGGQQFTVECLTCADPNDPACAPVP